MVLLCRVPAQSKKRIYVELYGYFLDHRKSSSRWIGVAYYSNLYVNLKLLSLQMSHN